MKDFMPIAPQSEQHRHLFKRYIAQASEYPPFTIDVDRAEGIYVWDTDGKRYIDFISGICVDNVGHRHPAVMAALEAQMKRYLHVMVYGEFIQSPQLDLAAALCRHLPKSLQKVFFVNSGSEAIEGAVKLARLYNHRSEIVSFSHSYHGSTMGAMSLLGEESIQSVFKPLLPQHRLLPYNDIDALSQITNQTCCVVAEVIQSGGGVIEASDEFLRALRSRCDEVGVLLIFDEIQTGFGRSGEWFAFEKSGVVPDVLCLAKGMGGGMPIGAFVSSPELMELLNNEHPLLGHASTFGGHPLSCVSALASLNVIASEDVLPLVYAKELYIREQLENIEAVESVRGRGLYLGVKLRKPEKTQAVVERCIQHGLIVFWPLFNKEVIDFTPPLTITNAQIDEALAIFRRAVEEVCE